MLMMCTCAARATHSCVRYDLFASQGFHRKDPTGAVTTGSCRHRSDAAASVAGSWSSTLPSSLATYVLSRCERLHCCNTNDASVRGACMMAPIGDRAGQGQRALLLLASRLLPTPTVWVGVTPPPDYSASITGTHVALVRSWTCGCGGGRPRQCCCPTMAH
jgi:hypothetical protein